MEGGMVAVDWWSDGSQAYFLTHLHSDHLSGLSSSWNKGPLFCSRTTAKLLPFKFPYFDVSLLRVVEVGSWYSLSLRSPSTGSPALVQVMAIDALHCPGSVMFLFRGEFGHVLYTGDFRWEAADEKAQKGRTMLLNALNGANVNVLYLDNTYCNPSYSFPSREVAAQQVLSIITSHPNCDIIIGIDTLGKEQLLTNISCMLKIKIWVWPERLQTMHLLGLPDIFTTKTSITRVRAVPRYSYTVDTVEGLNRTLRPTIGIMPSGLPWIVRHEEVKKSESAINDSNGTNNYFGSVEKVNEYMYTVPYSDHSCYSEIEEFVRIVKPLHIRGIVSISSCYVDPIFHLRHLLRTKHQSQSNHLRLKKEVGGDGKGASKSLACQESVGVNRKKRSRGDRVRIKISRESVVRKARRPRGSKIVESDGDND